VSTKRYLVTGGAGFIGSHMVRHLLEQGCQVTVLDNLSTGQSSNLTEVLDRLRFVEGSVASAADVEQAVREADGIVHLAALPSVARSVEEPLATHSENATGTVVVLDAARRAGIKVVYAGSSSAYGDQEVAAKHEALRENPLSPYAASKLVGELYCRSFSHVYGLPVVITRFFNVFGPRQVANSPYSGVIAAFSRALLRGERPRVDGDGRQSRDFTFVGDVVRGVRLALETDLEGCQVINVACGASHDLLELLDVLKRHAGVDVEPTFGPPRVGDVRHSMADIGKARRLLGFEPRVSFEDALAITFDWYKSAGTV
jgi:UDP-glucose 4-epimerase